MNLDYFDFDLPSKLIAQHPLENRNNARLLIGSSLTDKIFDNIVDYFNPGDILVLNDTKVLLARLFGNKSTGGKVEIMLDMIMSDNSATALIKSSKVPKIGDILFFTTSDTTMSATITSKKDMHYTLVFDSDIMDVINTIGHMPLPPYIKRKDTLKDRDNYQTVFAKNLGAVAAPTASLHFTTELLERIKHRGVAIIYLTLHVGSGTFLPIRTNDITTHNMHSEYYNIAKTDIQTILQAKQRRSSIIAVGTTVVRTLETIAKENFTKFSGYTDIFIYPGFKFQLVDRLITNFHLPKSTLLLLVSAFAGSDAIKEIYAHAINKQYRFFSYGDGMLLDKSN